MIDSSRTVRPLAIAGAAIVLLAACDGSGAEPTVPTTSETTEVATSSAPPTGTEAAVTSKAPILSPAEQDRTDVEATVVGYMAALDEAYEGADIEVIYPWSRDVARDTWITQLMAYDEQGLTIDTDRGVEVLEVEVNGDQADATACLDYSDVTVTDAEGQDITPDRESGDLILNDYVLERYEDGEHGWIVVDDISRSEPCDG